MGKNSAHTLDIIDEIRKDSKYKTFKKILERTQERLDLDRDRKEAMTLHAGRSSRTLYGNRKYSVKSLIDASLRDLSYRSRMVEMRVIVSKELSFLEEAAKDLTHYIYTQYEDHMSGYRNAEQRKSLTARVLRNSNALIESGNSFIELLDFFIKDIDQANFNLKIFIESLKLLDSSKGKVV